MELRLPLIIAAQAPNLHEAFALRVPSSVRVGASVSELRDEVSLAVMEHCARCERPESIAELALAPHHRLRTVEIEAVALDEKTRKRVALAGRVPVLVERWPHDDFLLVTPTRCPNARFALAREDELEEALARRLKHYILEKDLDSLGLFSSTRRERVEVLKVDIDPPSILSTRAVSAKRQSQSPRNPEEARRRARLSAATLRAVARDWTHAAADGLLEPAFGRDTLVASLLEATDAEAGAAIVLVGPSGVGKTAVVREFVRRLHQRDVEHGRRRGVWRLDANRFIAGMSVVGQWQARARALVQELRETRDLLFVDDLAALAFAGRTSQSRTNLAQFLTEPLARGALSVLAECTPDALERLRHEEPSFARLFRTLRVEPMSERESVSVVLAAARSFEAQHGETVVPTRPLGPDALEAVLEGARRHFGHEALPGAAIRLLKAVLEDERVSPPASVAADDERTQNPGPVSAREVLEVIGRRTGLPPFVLGLEPPRSRERIERELSAMVAAQPEAIDAATDVVLSVQSALGDPDKPLATFLFVGPTGVGKTETAKALAAYLYGSSQRLLRFDMSEFQTRESVARLVGDAHQPEGELTGALRAQPFRVVLFDEIEKAHPAVFDALLRLLGEGKICDAAGRPSDARPCVIVLTSNLGVREASARAGFLRHDPEEARRHYVRAAELFFRPEFFNRIDRVVAFRSLDQRALRLIVRNALREILSRRGVRRANVLVDVEPALLDVLVEQAFDPRYGARPLRRALERTLAVPLAYHVLERRGDDVTLIHALERRGELSLAVRLLREREAIELEDTSRWDERTLRAAFDGLAASVAELERAPWTQTLVARRARGLEALGRRGEAPTSARSAIELLDRLEALRDALRELDANELATTQFEEEEIPGEQARRRDARSSRYAQSTYVELPIYQSERLLLDRVKPTLLEARDEREVLAMLVRDAAERGDERMTLMLEPILPSTGRADEWASLVHAIPTFSAIATLFREDRPGVFVAVGPPTHQAEWHPGKTHAIDLEGPALSRMLEPYEGYALLSWSEPPDAVQLVRLTRVEGAMPEAADRYRARRQSERAALRERPEGTSEDEPAWLVLRSRGERLVHVATGLGAEAREAIVAALLRAR